MGMVTLEEARAGLARLVERAAAGEEFVIKDAGQAVAKLVPPDPAPVAPKEAREFDFFRGRVWVGPNFDAPLPPELQRAFDGEDH